MYHVLMGKPAIYKSDGTHVADLPQADYGSAQRVAIAVAEHFGRMIWAWGESYHPAHAVYVELTGGEGE